MVAEDTIPIPFPSSRCGFGILLSLAAVLLLCGEAGAQFDFAEPWPPEVKVLAPEGGFLEGRSAAVIIEIAAETGVHIYKEKIELSFEMQEGISFKETILPPAGEIPDILNPGEKVAVYEGTFQVRAVFEVRAPAGGEVRIKGAIAVQGCTDDTCFPPEETAFDLSGPVAAGEGGTGVKPLVQETEAREEASGAPPLEGKEGGLEIFLRILGAFGAGILLSLTPCVLPIIPITSAIIQRFSKGGTASALFSSCIYVFGLALTYAAAGVAVAFLGGSVRAFLSSNWVVGVIGGIFLLLALSMFGLFDIALPAGFAGKLQQRSAAQAQKNNRFALVFMGMISGLVAGPCLTAPLAALLVWIAQTGSPLIGFTTMFALAWGLGLLIILAGTFTGLLPKAGEWTEWFKRLFGFLMLWGALYFPRSLIGDQAYRIGTALVLVAGAVFLGGLDSLPADARWGSRLKKLLGVICIMGAFFIGFNTFADPGQGNRQPAALEIGKGGFIPGGKAELETALSEGMPAVLFFTADWCPNCKPFKKNIIHQPETLKAMEGMVALEVDFDREKELRERYGEQGAPTLVFIDARGRERKDLGFSGADKTVEELVALIERLGSGKE